MDIEVETTGTAAQTRGPVPRIHVVTDDSVLAHGSVAELGAELLNLFAPNVALHVRGPTTSSRRILEIGSAVADRAGPRNSSGAHHLVINDRVDVALIIGAGVHLGARSLPVAAARALVPAQTSIGRSVREHPEEGTGADYIFAGPVFTTPSHEGTEGRGIGWFEKTVADAEMPVLGIGGISAERIGVLLDAGGHGVALIRGFWEAPDPLRAAADLVAQIEDAE